MEETRAEHLAWCKERALRYFEEGNLVEAVTSMMSDLTKHPELGSCPPRLAQLAMRYVADNDRAGLHYWIVEFY